MKKFLLSLVSLFMLTLFAQAADVKIAYSGSTSNMTGDNDAALFGLSADDWSIVGAKGSASNMPGLNAAGDFRLYYNANGSNTITVTLLKDGATINKISGITFTGANYSNVTVSVDGNPVEAVDGEYAINGTSFVLGNGNTSNVQVRIKSIVLDVTGVEGNITHIANTAETAYTVAEAITKIDDPNSLLSETVFIKGIVSQVDNFNAGAIQYWISDDGTTTNQFECYKGKGIDGADFASIDDVKVGASVIVKGTMTKYNTTYEFTEGNELVSYADPVYIKNADFASLEGWTAVTSDGYKDLGNGLIGTYQVRSEFDAATVDESHLATEYCIGLEARWASSFASYTQTVTNLPAGSYSILYDVENVNAATTAAEYENRFTVTVGETVYTDSFTEWMKGKSAWTTHAIVFTVEEGQQVTISLGYGTGSNNYAVANTPALFVSHLQLADAATGEALILANAKAEKLAVLDAMVAGEGLFQYSQKAIDVAKRAVNAATTVEEVEAVEMPSMTLPDHMKQYTLQQKASGLYMSLSDGVKLAAKAYPLSWVATEGGWYIKNEDLYVGLAGSDNWTMSTDADKKLVITPAAVDVEGVVYYTLSEVKGMIASDGTEAGSACYTDKSVAKSGDKAYWSIAEYVAPVVYTVLVAETVNGTVVANPTEAEAGETITLTITPDEGYELDELNVISSNGVVVEIVENTFTMPAGNVKVTATFKEKAAEPVSSIIISKATGTYYDGGDNPLTDSGWGAKWVSTLSEPQLTLTASSGINVANGMHFGPAGVDYSLTVSEGYVITGYALTASNFPDGSSVLTPEGGEGQTFEAGVPNSVSGLNAQTVNFTITVGRAQVTNFEVFVEQAPSNDFTSYIVNADLTGEGGFDATGTKGIDGSGIVKCANNAQFDFKQTIAALPAGQYKLTAQAAYRYSGSEADEYAAIEAGTDTKLATLYATTAKKTYDSKVMNRWDGASETDYAAGDGSTTVNEKFVPNSSNAVKAWFAAGQYVNEVVFNLAEAGDVTIGIVKNAQPEAGDYTVLGPWTLTRLGDAEEEEEPTPALANGKYYLQNVATGLYWGAGNDWGTQACLLAHPDYVTLVSNEDGTYKLESQVSNGGTSYYFNGSYMDGNPVALTFTQSGDNYTIANGETYYGAPSSRATVTFEGTMVLGTTAADSQDALWKVIPEADMLPSLANATVEAPVDATFLIIDHTFGRNNRNVSAWNNDGGAALTGGNSNRHCAEKYHGVYNVSQTLANAPKGVYRLEAQGFYRQDGSDNENLPVIYANDVTAQFPLLTTSENSMDAACTSFNSGLYKIEPIFVKVDEGGTLTVGTKLETNTTLWCIWDNFVLTYYGDCDIAEAKFAGLNAEVKALREEATELQANTDVAAPNVTALTEALAATESIEATEEAYNAAIVVLKAAVNQANLDVANKAVIDEMYATIDGTNFYTAEAYEAYKGEADGYKEAYEAGTLTNKLSAVSSYGWHVANTFDDFLLSAWAINDVQAKDFDTSLYINSWSTEGNNDGSEFKVPFFEYWTGDANSLAASKLTATVTGLPEGLYTVDAWVRVRGKNNFTAPAYGITADVNEGEAVDVCTGEAVEGTNFYIAKFTAVGRVTEEGVLKFNLNVAEDNNISWLSFKNVKYAAKDETEYAYEQALASIEDGGTYRVFTQVGDNKFYLNSTGYLVAEAKQAATFTFAKVNASGTLYETGLNLGCKFTNPTLTGGSSGDVVKNGHIIVGGNDRNDWERQVFFLKDGKYAVRATNANSANWGANTYWSVDNVEAELPNAEYSLEPAYVWQIEANVDNRPEAFAKTQTWAAKLQAVEGLVTEGSQWYSNAKEPSEGSYEALVDGEYTTFFHSAWSVSVDEAHYLQAELSEPVQDFYFYFKKRSQNNNNRPTDIVITASNDGENFTDVTEINSGLPTGAAPIDYTSGKISMDQAYKTVRFAVAATSNGTKFFTFSEFYILPSNELTDAARQYMVADYTDLEDTDTEAIDAIDERINVLYQAYLDKAEIAAVIERIREITAAGNEISQAANKEDMFAAEDIEAHIAAIVTLDDANAGLATVKSMVAEYVAEVNTRADLNITNAFIENAPAITKTGWEGTDFGTASNGVCEYWNKSAADFHQTISLPAGTYKLTVVALQRTGMTGYVYAGENQTTIAQVENTVANSRSEAATWFAAGNGKNEVEFTLAEAADVVIGLTTDKDNDDHWTVWQGFTLEKVGTHAPADVTLASVTLDGEPVVFDGENNYIVEGKSFDQSMSFLFSATAGDDVDVEVTYPTEIGETQIVITVTDKLNADNKAVYTITFEYATGINGINVDADKAVIYDMNGRRVARTAKGVLIINGKKTLRK